jgi:hypothetical protein
MSDEMKERSFRHVGIGLPHKAIVMDTVKSLTDNGAVIVRKDEGRCKFFLKLNPADVLEIEIFVSDGVDLHFDKSVRNTEDIAVEAGKELVPCEVPNMLFLSIGKSYLTNYPFEVEMAFFEELFDWAPWIPEIERVAADNNVLEISITKEEWERLEKDKMASLKGRLSKNASDRLHLFGCTVQKRFSVTVCRYCGMCQNC